MTKQILYISYDGMTDALGQSQVIPYLKDLSQYGYQFHILSAEKPENYHANKAEISALLKSYGIEWHPVMYTKKPPVVSTIKDIRSITSKAIELHKQFGFSLCHARSYISAFAALKLKQKYDIPFLFDMRGFFADERVDGNLWPLSNPVFKAVYIYFKRKEKQFFSNCDHLISLTEVGKSHIINKMDVNLTDNDITVIPCCADLHHFNYKRLDTDRLLELKEKLNLSDKDFVVSYLGSVGTWYLPNEMLDFFKALLKEKANSKFLLITRDNPLEILQLASEKGIPHNRLVIQSASREQVPYYIATSDISLFFIKPVFSKMASSPTKLAEILAMGKPVICNGGVGDLNHIIEKTKAGAIISNFTNMEYSESISKINNLLKKDPSFYRDISQQLFSLHEGTQRYLTVYNCIEK